MSNLLQFLFGRSAKFVAALIGQALTFALAYYGHGNEWVTLAVAVAAALGVYAVPNTPASPAVPPNPAPAQEPTGMAQ